MYNFLNVTTFSNCSGYTGWDCTDFTNPAIFPFMSTVLLIFSNAFFIPAIYISVKRKLYAEGLVYLATMLISSLYHACDQTGGQFCIVKYEVCHWNFLHFYVKLRKGYILLGNMRLNSSSYFIEDRKKVIGNKSWIT